MQTKLKSPSDIVEDLHFPTPAQPLNNQIGNGNDVLTIAEVAAILRCSKNHVSRVLNGKVAGLPTLTHFVMGRRKLVRREWLSEWMERHKKRC